MLCSEQESASAPPNPPPSLLPVPVATHLSITHSPLGLPSSVEILKLKQNVLSLPAEEISA